MDEERELLADIEKEMERNHAVGRLPSRSSPSPPRFTAKEKGKGRAVLHEDERQGDGASEDEEEEEEQEEGDDEPGSKTTQYTPGPLSADALKEALQLGEQVEDAFKALAKKYNKSTRTMMIASGLTIQNARQGQNISNKFKQWYAAKHPVVPGSKYPFICSFILCFLQTKQL